jgi:hypothetical protein
MKQAQSLKFHGLMAPSTEKSSGRRGLLGRRNIIVLAAATVSLVVGYLTLQAGAVDLAAGLLVLGYCVLFPLAIAL